MYQRALTSAAVALVTAASTLTVTPSTAEARHWGHRGGWIGLGIAGAVLGGYALSRHRYYDDPYYYDYDYDYPYYYGRRYYSYRTWGHRGHGWAGHRGHWRHHH